MKNTINEKWAPVKGYEGLYEVSITGEVKGIDRMVITTKGLRTIKCRILKTRINNAGYLQIKLSKNDKKITTFTHILIARAFIPNPLNKPEVNHINGIKTDNRIENLEWNTRSENMKHAYRTGLLKPNYKEVIDLCTGRRYTSTYQAARDLNINYKTCSNYLNGNRKNKTCLEYAN